MKVMSKMKHNKLYHSYSGIGRCVGTEMVLYHISINGRSDDTYDVRHRKHFPPLRTKSRNTTVLPPGVVKQQVAPLGYLMPNNLSLFWCNRTFHSLLN